MDNPRQAELVRRALALITASRPLPVQPEKEEAVPIKPDVIRLECSGCHQPVTELLNMNPLQKLEDYKPGQTQWRCHDCVVRDYSGLVVIVAEYEEPTGTTLRPGRWCWIELPDGSMRWVHESRLRRGL